MQLPRPTDKIKNTALALILTAAAAGLALVRLAANGVPAAPAGPDAQGIDPDRLRAHVRALASEPHPVGSKAHERARQYLLSALRAEGIEPVTQAASAVSPLYMGFSSAARVENVIARLPGNPGTDAILIASHYDSVRTGPGAADDGSAAAGMLEAVRALKAMGPLRHDIVFLFSDGEELGLIGAQAFADESPLMKNVRAVFNFEARGTSGPVILFETGPESAGLVQGFLEADPHPQGTSLGTAVYTFLPNNTDFTVFKDRKLPGLNFACIGDLPAYHTRLDAPGRLDPRTLSLQAEHIFTCARTFGNADLGAVRREEIVFFPLIGSLILNYSWTLAAALAAGTILLLTAVLVFGMRSKLISLKKTLAGAGSVLLLAVVSGALAWGASLLLGALHPENRPLAELYNAAPYRVALGLLPLFPALLLRRLWGQRLSAVHLLSGACLVFAVLLGLTAVALPGASYLFQWPLFFGVVLLGFLILAGKRNLPPAVAPAVIACFCVPALFLGIDAFSGVSAALSLSLSWVFCPVLVLLLALAWPLFDLVLSKGKALFPLLAAAAFTAAVVAGTLSSGFDAGRPRPEAVTYGLDADHHRAYWIGCPNMPGGWSGQFFGAAQSVGPLPDIFPMTTGCLNQPEGFRHADAPAVDLAAPLLTLRSATPTALGRELRLVLRSPRGAPQAAVFIRRGPGLGDIMIDGKKIKEVPFDQLKPILKIYVSQFDYRHWVMINFSGLPAEGVELRLAAGPEPLTIKVLDMSDELPEAAARGFTARPPESMPAHTLLVTDGTKVAKEYRF